jgi:hypothetical protein
LTDDTSTDDTSTDDTSTDDTSTDDTLTTLLAEFYNIDPQYIDYSGTSTAEFLLAGWFLVPTYLHLASF